LWKFPKGDPRKKEAGGKCQRDLLEISQRREGTALGHHKGRQSTVEVWDSLRPDALFVGRRAEYVASAKQPVSGDFEMRTDKKKPTKKIQFVRAAKETVA